MANKITVRPTSTPRVAASAGAAVRSRGQQRRRSGYTRSLPRPLLVGGVLVTLLLIAGVTWFALAAGHSRGGAIGELHTADYHSLTFSPTDSKVLFFGHHNGIQRSDDGGRTWQPLVTRTNFDAMGMGVNRTDPQQMYIAGHQILQASRDGGATWRAVANNLPGTDLHGFAVSPDNTAQLFAFAVDYGVFSSTDGGATWQLLSDKLPGDVMSLTAAGGNPATLYVTTMGSGLFRSSDGGKNWAPVAQSSGSGSARAIAADPATAKTL